jgi:hypothetical protein
LPRIRNSLGIKGALQLVGVQNAINNVIHRKNSRNTRYGNNRSAAFRISAVNPTGRRSFTGLAYRPIGASARARFIGTWCPEETISPNHEIGLKRIPATGDGYQATGAVMLTFILNSIYREFLRSSVSGMRKHHFVR